MVVEMVVVAASGGLWAILAAICVRRPGRRRMEGAVDDPSPTMVLAMVAALIGQGASVTRSLMLVGSSCGGELGGVLRRASEALEEGLRWSEAWVLAMAGGDGHAGPPSGRTRRTAETVRDALEDSWMHGSSPMTGLRLTIEGSDAEERARIEREAAKLSVRILMPVGLCMLPAFICVAVIPLVASMFPG